MQVFRNENSKMICSTYPYVEEYRGSVFIKSPFGNCQTFSLALADNFFLGKPEKALNEVIRYGQTIGKPQCFMDLTYSMWAMFKADLPQIEAMAKLQNEYTNSNGNRMVLVLLQLPI